MACTRMASPRSISGPLTVSSNACRCCGVATVRKAASWASRSARAAWNAAISVGSNVPLSRTAWRIAPSREVWSFARASAASARAVASTAWSMVPEVTSSLRSSSTVMNCEYFSAPACGGSSVSVVIWRSAGNWSINVEMSRTRSRTVSG